jgi:hypothetical protein
MLNNPANFAKYVNNATKEEKAKGIYRPNLTALKRGNKIFLKAQFSAPKMLFGNNVEEVDEDNFNDLAKALQQAIKEMGVMLWIWQIENAEVSSFHPSKNIILSKGYTSSFVINELSKINLNTKMDLTKTQFRNEGESLQFYANRHSLAIYDKKRDINKSIKRSIDDDQVKPQLNLIKYLNNKTNNIEILKIEPRLSHKAKMKEVLEEVGYTGSPLFQNIFKKELCMKILQLYWNKFFGKDRFLFTLNNDPQRILQLILNKYPKTRITTAIMLVGLNLLCKDDGIRAFRNIAKNYRPKTNWIKLSGYLKKFEDDVFCQPLHGYIKDIEEALDNYVPFRYNGSGQLTCLVKNCKV